MEKEFLAATAKVPSIRNFGSANVDIAVGMSKIYGPFAGLGLGLLAWVASIILLGILKLVRLAKFKLANMIVLFLVYGAYLALAIELIYYEIRFSVVSIAVIFFIGYPLYYASIATLILIFVVYLLSMILGFFRKKRNPAPPAAPTAEVPPATPPTPPTNIPAGTIAMVALAIAMPFFLSGCSLIGGSEEMGCELAPDPAHCYQDAAVSQGDADICDKVVQPEKFKDMGSNPPQDKCYLMVAENTGSLDACEKIKGGLMSYSKDDCILEISLSTENPDGCQMLSGENKAKCAAELSPKITPEKVLEVDDQINVIKNELQKGSDPELDKQLKGLEDKRNNMLAIMTKDNKAQYDIQSDPLNKEIIGDWAMGDIDNTTKNKLVNMNEQLKTQGLAMTKEQYEAVRDYYKFVNDPNNNIETMDDSLLAKDNVGDKLHNVVDKLKFWKVKDTPVEKAEDVQLRFYERMLERDKAIDDGLTVKEQAYENTMDKLKEVAVEKGADIAKEKIIEHIFGEAAGLTTKVTTVVLGEAINEVKAEAKSEEFRGLVNAYNQGIQEELAGAGGNVDKAHAAVVKKLMADPYAYATGDSFAKYGNLIENKDCDGSNPHCLNKDVFWKAMKKSYNYQHPGQ